MVKLQCFTKTICSFPTNKGHTNTGWRHIRDMSSPPINWLYTKDGHISIHVKNGLLYAKAT